MKTIEKATAYIEDQARKSGGIYGGYTRSVKQQWYEAPLPFPTRKTRDCYGNEIEEYLIPDESRQEVLNDLYIFENPPKINDVLFDIHEEKPFTVGDYKVMRYDDQNWLVSPYFEHSGGSIIDWVPMSHAF